MLILYHISHWRFCCLNIIHDFEVRAIIRTSHTRQFWTWYHRSHMTLQDMLLLRQYTVFNLALCELLVLVYISSPKRWSNEHQTDHSPQFCCLQTRRLYRVWRSIWSVCCSVLRLALAQVIPRLHDATVVWWHNNCCYSYHYHNHHFHHDHHYHYDHYHYYHRWWHKQR